MDMLSDPAARRAVFGAELPFDLPFRVAAKTGTSAGYADTVAIAATSEVVVAAWAGAFDGSGTRGQLAMWSAAPLARAALLCWLCIRARTTSSGRGGIVLVLLRSEDRAAEVQVRENARIDRPRIFGLDVENPAPVLQRYGCSRVRGSESAWRNYSRV